MKRVFGVVSNVQTFQDHPEDQKYTEDEGSERKLNKDQIQAAKRKGQ